MPYPEYSEIQHARAGVGAAPAITQAASDLIAGLTQLASAAGSTPVFSIEKSSTDVVLNFRVSTILGPIEAVFDYAFKGDRLVGRYRFFTLQDLPGGVISTTEIWAVLFDANHCATWDTADDAFGWQFAPGVYQTAQMLGDFMFRLFARLQGSFQRY